jgi:hypothetical protein
VPGAPNFRLVEGSPACRRRPQGPSQAAAPAPRGAASRYYGPGFPVLAHLAAQPDLRARAWRNAGRRAGARWPFIGKVRLPRWTTLAGMTVREPRRQALMVRLARRVGVTWSSTALLASGRYMCRAAMPPDSVAAGVLIAPRARRARSYGPGMGCAPLCVALQPAVGRLARLPIRWQGSYGNYRRPATRRRRPLAPIGAGERRARGPRIKPATEGDSWAVCAVATFVPVHRGARSGCFRPLPVLFPAFPQAPPLPLAWHLPFTSTSATRGPFCPAGSGLSSLRTTSAEALPGEAQARLSRDSAPEDARTGARSVRNLTGLRSGSASSSLGTSGCGLLQRATRAVARSYARRFPTADGFRLRTMVP